MSKRWLQIIMVSLAAGFFVFFPAISAQAQTGTVTANKVNVRDAGSLESNVLYMVNTGQPVEILGTAGDFYYVNLPESPGVYIAQAYVSVDAADMAAAATGSVTDENVWIFETPPDGDGISVLGTANINAGVDVLGTCGEWLYIKHNGVEGYVYSDAIAVNTPGPLPERLPYVPAAQVATTAAPMAMEVLVAEDIPLTVPPAPPVADGELVDQIITYAKELLGIPYTYGSMNPSNGFDCSGFISYVLKQFDVSISRSSSSMATEGTSVGRDELQKGDLIFFATSGGSRISHVGMYIGGGEFIHSSSWGEGVVITRLDEKYYSNCYIKSTRIF